MKEFHLLAENLRFIEELKNDFWGEGPFKTKFLAVKVKQLKDLKVQKYSSNLYIRVMSEVSMSDPPKKVVIPSRGELLCWVLRL